MTSSLRTNAASYQTEAALTAALRSLSATEAQWLRPTDVIARYLHRQRTAFALGKESHRSVVHSASNISTATGAAMTGERVHCPSPPVLVLVLGDDGMSSRASHQSLSEGAKQQLADAIRGVANTSDIVHQDSNSKKTSDPEGGVSVSAGTFDLDEADAHDEILVLAPSIADGALVRELARWCDVVIGCYRADSLGSVHSLTERWLPLWQAASMDQQREAEEQRRAGCALQPGPMGWLSDEPAPLFLVGMRGATTADEVEHNRKRSHARSTIANNNTTSGPHVLAVRAAADQLAASAKAARLLEVQPNDARHSAILRRHCVLARDGIYETHPMAAQASFLRAKIAALRLLLRVPPPRVVARALQDEPAAAGGFVAAFTLAVSGPGILRSGEGNEHTRTWRRSNRSVGTNKDVLVRSDTVKVPLSGDGSSATSAAVEVYHTGRCLFPSESLALVPPPLSAVPAGFYDPLDGCFRLTRGWESDAAGEAALRYAWRSRDEEKMEMAAREKSAHMNFHEGRNSCETLPMRAVRGRHIPLVTESGCAYEPGCPWPDGVRAPPSALVLEAATVGLSRVLAVPHQLPTPLCRYALEERAIHLTPFPPPPHVAYHYTLDGTTPTAASAVYTGPLYLGGEGERQRQVRLRAAAFPRPFLPSREAMLEVDADSSVMVRSRFQDPVATLSSSPAAHVWLGSERDFTSSATPSTTHGGPTSLGAEARSSRGRSQGRDGGVATTRAQQLREGYHRGAYVPPYVPFLSGTPQDVAGRDPKSSSAKHHHETHRLQHRRPGSSADTHTRSSSHSSPPMGTAAHCFATTERESDKVEEPHEWTVALPPLKPPLRLTHVVVVTAGGSRGPTTYRLEAQHPHGVQRVVLAWGELARRAGAQTIVIPEDVASFPIGALYCTFTGTSGDEVEDIRVHGSPVSEW